MPNRRFGWQTFSRLLISLLVVLMPLAAVAYFYFGQKLDYHVSRNFRILNAAGRHLSNHLDTLENVLRNASIGTSERETIEDLVEQKFETDKSKKLVASDDFMVALENALKFERERKSLDVPWVDAVWKEVAKKQVEALGAFGGEESEFSYEGKHLRFQYVNDPNFSSLYLLSSPDVIKKMARDRFTAEPLRNETGMEEFLSFVDSWDGDEVKIYENKRRAVAGFMAALENALKFEREQKPLDILWLNAVWKEVAKKQAEALGAFGGEESEFSYEGKHLRFQYVNDPNFSSLYLLSSPDVIKKMARDRFTAEPLRNETGMEEFLSFVDSWDGDEVKIYENKRRAVAGFMASLRSTLEDEALWWNLWKKVGEEEKVMSTEIDMDPASDKSVRESYKDTIKLYKSYLNQQEDTKNSERELNRLRQNPIFRSIKISNPEKKCTSPNESTRLMVDSSRIPVSLILCRQQGQAELPLADLMLNMDIETSNFDLLVVANEDGDIFYSSADKSPDSSRGIFTEFMSLESFFRQDGSEVKTDLSPVSVTRKAEVAGSTYRLFLQPFRPPFPVISDSKDSDERLLNKEEQKLQVNADETSSQAPKGTLSQASGQEEFRVSEEQIWYLGGIIQEDAFQVEYMTIPFTVAGLVTLGLILGILSWPYLKIFFIGSGEKIQAFDIFFLVISLFLGSGLVTLLLLDTIAYYNLRNQFDETAWEVTESMQRQFKEELKETLEALYSVPDIVTKKDPNKIPINLSDKLNLKKSDDDSEDVEWTLPFDRYPLLDSMFLVTDKGWLDTDVWINYGLEKRSSGMSLSQRNYFSHVMSKERLWQIRPDKEESEGKSDAFFLPFFIERVYPYTDGVKSSIVVRPLKKDESLAESLADYKVAGLKKHFLVFRESVLPAYFGFAVIQDGTGKVLFHSDDRRSLIENFFWETDDDLRLQAAIQAREKNAFSGQYHGSGHRFLVQPIANLPWTLVVFYDIRLLEAVVFELGVIAAGIFIFYIFMFILGIAAVQLFVPGIHWSWCWPNSEFQNRYFWVCMLFVLIIIYYGLGIWLLEGPLLFLIAVSLPLFILGILYLSFEPKRKVPVRVWKRNVAWLALSLGTIGGVSGWFEMISWITGITGTVTMNIGFLLISSVIAGVSYLTLIVLSLPPNEKPAQNITVKRDFWRQYLLVAFFGLLIISVFPSVVIFKDTFHDHAYRLTKFRQLTTILNLDRFERVLIEDMTSLDSGEVEKSIKESEKFVENVVFPSLNMQTEDQVCLYTEEQNNVSEDQIRCTGDKNLSNICTSSNSFSKNQKGLRNGSPEDSGYDGSLSNLVSGWLPVYNELAGKIKYPKSDKVDHRWEWWSQGDTLCLSRSEHAENLPYRMTSPLPSFFPLTFSWWISLTFCFVSLFFLFIVFVLLKGLSDWIVGLRISNLKTLKRNGTNGRMIEQLIEGKKSRILISPPISLMAELEERTELETIDLSAPTSELLKILRLWDTIPRLRTRLLVKNFEFVLLDPQLRMALLKFLEDDSYHTVILCSSISPLPSLTKLGAYPESGVITQDENQEGNETFRWSTLLSNFQMERFPYEAPDWRHKSTLLKAVLSRECCWTRGLTSTLRPVWRTLRYEEKKMGRQHTEEQIINQVSDRAESFYRRLWMLCSKEERLVLLHLAQGNLVNLQNLNVVEGLMRRNLIRCDPDFRLPSQSFTRFVLTAEPPERITEWEGEEARGIWAILRVPFLLLLALVAAFISYTGGEALLALASLIPAVLAGLPAILTAAQLSIQRSRQQADRRIILGRNAEKCCPLERI